MRKSNKSAMAYKCDYCGTNTSSFVTTAEYKHFCRLQTPGQPADKDCMENYIRNKNVQKKEKEEGLFTQEKVGIQKKEIKLVDKTIGLKKLEELKQFINEKKYSNLNLK